MKDTFASRMALAVRESRKTLQEIADLAGTSKGQVSQWQTEGRVQPEKIKAHVVENICAVLGIRPRWLLYGELPMQSGGDDDSSLAHLPPGNYVRFQLLDVSAGMGTGSINADHPEVLREITMAVWEVRRKLGFLPQPNRIRLFTGRGSSMQPMLDNGDVAMVDTVIDHFDGDAIYAINLNGYTQIKQLQMRPDGLYVVSVNPQYPSYRVPPEESDTLHILGKVVGVIGVRQM